MKVIFLINYIIICIISLMLSSCSFLDNKRSEKADIIVLVSSPDRIRFSGKGAGAGMMMSSSMGSMGIAIGVAIDEGIGKAIHSAFIEKGGNFSSLVKAESERWLSDICVKKVKLQNLCSTNSQLKINIYRYGFVTASGEGDLIKPELEVGFKYNQNPENRLSLKNVDLTEAILPLSVAREEGKVIFNSLHFGLQQLLIQYENFLFQK